MDGNLLIQCFGKEKGGLFVKYASATGMSTAEVLGIIFGTIQPLTSNSSIQYEGRSIKNDLNYVVVDESGNAATCAKRLQEIRNKLLDPKRAQALAEADAKWVETDPLTGKQKVHFDDNTASAMFIVKPDTAREIVRNKSLEGRFQFFGDGKPLQKPPKSDAQKQKDAKVIEETEKCFSFMFRTLLGVGDQSFHFSEDAEKLLKSL